MATKNKKIPTLFKILRELKRNIKKAHSWFKLVTIMEKQVKRVARNGSSIFESIRMVTLEEKNYEYTHPPFSSWAG